MKDAIIIKPLKLQDYTCKQSKHDIVPKLPLRGIWLAPSGSGKTVLLSNLILNVYLDCYERLYIFSPSVHVDQTWQGVKDYQEQTMKLRHTPTCNFMLTVTTHKIYNILLIIIIKIDYTWEIKIYINYTLYELSYEFSLMILATTLAFQGIVNYYIAFTHEGGILVFQQELQHKSSPPLGNSYAWTPHVYVCID